MSRKTAFVNKMILQTLNQHQQTVPPAVQKAATLDYEVCAIFNRKNVNNHDKAKTSSDVLQKYLTAITHTKKPITISFAIYPFVYVQRRIHLGNVPKIQDTS